MSSGTNRRREVVAVLPAAGRSLRLAPLPCSKEILPVGLQAMAGQGPRLRVVSHYLLECLHKADIRMGYIVIRQGKWDIPAYWEGEGNGRDESCLCCDSKVRVVRLIRLIGRIPS